MSTSEFSPFVRYLCSLAEAGERGALAALRRGLGRPPGTAVEMFRYVEPWLPAGCSRAQEAAYYLIASLFALHPIAAPSGNMGNHLLQAAVSGGEDALERRFTALLAAHSDDLPHYLRQAISFLKSKEIPVNWEQLLRDVLNWDHPERFVQKNWARAFWGPRSPAPQDGGPQSET